VKRVGVVVPVYNVAAYLEQCLSSIAAQTHTDLDVVVVDDGSTDDSAAIALAFCTNDYRFRMVQQPNGGLGNARNNGVGLVSGDLLAFVDSDDLLPPRAYEQLVGALEDSESDFAAGAFRRLDSTGSRPAYYAASAFARTRKAEHIRSFHPLVVDRTAWNKVFRREFWDRHGFRFAEGVQYEDQYATLPAYFLAQSVEVLSSPVYYWRIRDDGDRSITQGREEPRAVRDRLTAIGWTSRWLAEQGFDDDKLWYDASVFAQDLVYVPQVLAESSYDDRVALVALVDSFLADADAHVHDGLRAVDRIAWQLVRQHRWDDLHELLRFSADVGPRAAPRRRLRHWYLAPPVRPGRGLPRELFRLDDEIAVVSRIARIAVAEGRLRIEGTACLSHLGAPDRRSQTVRVRAVNDEADGELVFDVSPVARPGLELVDPPVAADVKWAGFGATLDLSALASLEPGDWRVVIEVESRSLRRETDEHATARLSPLRGATAALSPTTQVRAEPAGGGLAIHVEPAGPVLTTARLEGSTLVLEGTAAVGSGTSGWLRLAASGEKRVRLPIEVSGSGGGRIFTARVELDELRSDLAVPTAPQTLRRQALDQWDLTLRVGKTSARVLLAEPLLGLAWACGARSWVLSTNRPGGAVLVERVPRPVFRELSIRPDGAVELRGHPADVPQATEMLLHEDGGRSVPLGVDRDGGDVRVTVPALPADGMTWDVAFRPAGEDGPVVPCALAEGALTTLPRAAGGVVVGVRGRDGIAVYR
jgi:CDP-glycerol glycerophosphotransferase